MPKALRTLRQQRLQELLAVVRKAKKLTRVDVAERLGRPQSFVAKYEGGERRLDVKTAARRSEALKLDHACRSVSISSHQDWCGRSDYLRLRVQRMIRRADKLVNGGYRDLLR